MNNKAFNIDNRKCIHCGHCIEVCPVKLLKISSSDNITVFKENVTTDCIECGHCSSVCPTNAISLPGVASDNNSTAQASVDIGFNKLSTFLKSRRSIRTYQDKSVEKEKIEQIFDTARYAPSGANTQFVQWQIFSKEEELIDLTKLTIVWMEQVLSDKTNGLFPPEIAFFQQCINAWKNNRNIVLRNAPHLVLVHGPKESMLHIDSTIALDYFELAAASAGLGTCWAGGFYNASTRYQPLINYLNLPDGHICYGAILLGYPKFKYRTIPKRNSSKVICR